MKKYLLPENGQFFKANLHCHTTVSDGCLTPQEVKEHYMAEGYSIVAYTDHDVLISHPELKSEDFLPLNGFEIEVEEHVHPHPSLNKCCHICFVALEPDQLRMPFHHRNKHVWGNALKYLDQLVLDPDQPDYERHYSHEGINDMVRLGRENGFFVTYNHPTWSMEDYRDYSGYEGFNAVEILNGGCEHSGYEDLNSRVYDDMLRCGKRLYALATDDNHNMKDMFCGWVMIKADKLDYRTVTRALEKGEFYASAGPRIEALWFEDDQLHVRCSGAARISLVTGRRRCRAVYPEPGSELTEASFKVVPMDGYVRLVVRDAQGRCAFTNAYFMDELLAE